MRSRSIAGVTFDLWQTLILDEPEKDLVRRELRCQGLCRALSRFGIDLAFQDILRGYDESAIWFQTFWRRNEDISTVEQIRYIVSIASKSKVLLPQEPSVIEELQEAYTAPVFSVLPVLNEHVFSTLECLRRRAYKIGLISNTGRSPGRTLRRLLDRFGILKFFDATIFSNEVGWLKPDRRIFMAAADRLEVEPVSILHVGDDPERDVWDAKQVGMKALLLRYEVPEGFKTYPGSLLALGRGTRSIKDSEIKPDGQVNSLKEALEFVDSHFP